MLPEYFEQTGEMRTPRKYMTCGSFVEKTGIYVPVVVGGSDVLGNGLNSAEVFYDRYRQVKLWLRSCS